MGATTGISWTDSTWNPIRGCSRVSEGCRNCYAETVAYRFSGEGQPYEGLAVLKNGHASWTGKVEFIEKHLLDPLKWKPILTGIARGEGELKKKKLKNGDTEVWRERPRRIFVNSMSDLFHENVTDEMRDKIFAVMALCPQHIFQVLTKRPERMYQYIRFGIGGVVRRDFVNSQFHKLNPTRHPDQHVSEWPLPNVWLGTSVENQKCAEERIPYLMDTPAAIRFLSCEPLLGPINLGRLEYMDGEPERHDDGSHTVSGYCIDALEGTAYDDENGELSTAPDGEVPLLGKIHQCITGGESGARARPMASSWADGLREQCEDSGTSFFHKQNGEFVDAGHEEFGRLPSASMVYMRSNGSLWPKDGVPTDEDADVLSMKRVGRKRAGDTLYGKVYHEFPA